MGGMNPRLRFSLWNLLAIIALIAGGLGIHRAFWDAGLSNYQIYLGVYLAVFSIATVWVFSPLPPVRNSQLVFVVFGWLYLLVVLRAGFGIATMSDAIWLCEQAQLGIALAVLSAIAGHLVSTLGGHPK